MYVWLCCFICKRKRGKPPGRCIFVSRCLVVPAAGEGRATRRKTTTGPIAGWGGGGDGGRCVCVDYVDSIIKNSYFFYLNNSALCKGVC